MDVNISEWLNLFVRWAHIITGIAWIGASFYFNWLNNSLEPPEDKNSDVAGKLWAIHGGGFYHVQMYKVAPGKLPEHLHWFKWEAYFTWLTGISLLAIIYYLGADNYLVNKEIADISSMTGIIIGIASIIGGWIIYDLLCKSSLIKKPALLTSIIFILIALASVLLVNVFNPRAAYIHIGAIIGTIMAANVFFGIIPAQQEMVNAMKENRAPNAEAGKRGKLRSLHNNYFTLPLLFIMISNHYPMTYGHHFNWIVLLVISIAGVFIRHWFNLRGKGMKNNWLIPISIVLFILVIIGASLTKDFGKIKITRKVSFSEVNAIMQKRCVACHSEKPSDNVFIVAPSGVKYDTPAQIKKMVSRIKQRAVDTKSMPLGNKTKMSDNERAILGAWIESGAKLTE